MEFKKIAEKIARSAHAGQKRRGGGQDYFPFHVERVAKSVEEHLTLQEASEETIDRYVSVALLHDVLEDTKYKEIDLIILGLPRDIIEPVVSITKRKGEDYCSYLKRVKADDVAAYVKLRDIRDNLFDDPTKKQVEKYAAAIAFLLKK